MKKWSRPPFTHLVCSSKIIIPKRKRYAKELPSEKGKILGFNSLWGSSEQLRAWFDILQKCLFYF